MENDLVKKVSEIEIQDYPTIISSNVEKIKKIKQAIEENKILAKKLKTDAEKLKTAEVTLNPTTWFNDNKKDAIEGLQKNSRATASALFSITEGQELLFEYQKNLTDITKFLFGLGVSSLAANRTVIRQLMLELKNGTDAEKAKLVEDEINKVIADLRAQQDIMLKQKELEEKAKINHQDIIKIQDNQIEQNKKYDSISSNNKKRIDSNIDRLNKKDEVDAEQQKRIDSNIDRLNKKDEVDAEQQKRIDSNIDRLNKKDEVDAEQQKKIHNNIERLNKKDEVDAEQQKKIHNNIERLNKKDKLDAEQSKKIKEIEEKIEIQSKEIIKLIKSKNLFTIFSFISILLSLFLIFKVFNVI